MFVGRYDAVLHVADTHHGVETTDVRPSRIRVELDPTASQAVPGRALNRDDAEDSLECDAAIEDGFDRRRRLRRKDERVTERRMRGRDRVKKFCTVFLHR